MNIAIIPARGGSKRIPRKNIKPFCGKPLIAYSIETAIKSQLFERIIVSTDDQEIAEVAIQYGAEVPFFRPSELADDHTGTGKVIDHAIKKIQESNIKYDFLCTIYATAPLLQEKYLIEGYNQLKDSQAQQAFSATSMPFPIQRTFKITSDNRCEMFTPEFFTARSQDLEEAYQDAGQFYWQNLNKKSTKIGFSSDCIPIILPRYLVQDIDTPEDWLQAELLFNIIQQREKNNAF